MKKPNILLITADQMRSDALGCSGNAAVKTPCLDRLAEGGVMLRNAFTPSPICVPARASITTGCYPHKCTGLKSNSGSIRKGFPLLGEELNRRGYKTYAMGKLHYLPYMPPGKERTTYGIQTVELCESGRILRMHDAEGKLSGVEDYHDYLKTAGWGGYARGHGLGNNEVIASVSPVPREHYVDAWVADRVIHHLLRHLDADSSSGFFMWASFPKPHPAFDPPRPYDSIYDPRTMSAPAGGIELVRQRKLDLEYALYMSYMWDLLSPEAKKTIKASYYGLVSFQDLQAGRILDFLREKGVYDNTIIIYTADHGELLGDFGLYHKKSFYNGSVRIPMIMAGPGISEGSASGCIAGLQDILPTVLSLAGMPLDAEIDGEDLAPVLKEDKKVRDFYVSQCGEGLEQQYMLFEGAWKYIYHCYGGIEELYNQDDDTLELENLAGDGGTDDIKKSMRKKLTRWCVENGDSAVLEGGRLKELPLMDEKELLTGYLPVFSAGGKRSNTFGRRMY